MATYDVGVELGRTQVPWQEVFQHAGAKATANLPAPDYDLQHMAFGNLFQGFVDRSST